MSTFVTPLLAWYAANHRRLPWREGVSPYAIWLSEIMLQQTRVDTVLPYWRRFLARFPDVGALAAADLQEVLKLWQGLGYYSRARNLHAAAREVVARHGGAFPASLDGLAALPGVGPYTAAAIASMAFGVPAPVQDGNVLRVFARWLALEVDVRTPAARRPIQALLASALVAGDGQGGGAVDPGTFNNAIMELGALVCTPRDPACTACPLAPGCGALAAGRVADLPVRVARSPVPHHQVAVGLVWRDGHVLVARRPVTAMLGGLWELPGGKRRPRESLEATARREIAEETGLTVAVGAPLVTVRHAYTHLRITLTAFHCTVLSGEARPLASDEVRWVLPADLARLPLPRATEKVVEALVASGYSDTQTR